MKSSTSFWRRVMAMGAIIANKRRTARESSGEGSQIGTWGRAGPKREREVCFCETASVLREQAERRWCWEAEMRMLIAEHDWALGAFLARGFEAEGYAVTLAGDGEKALEAVRANVPVIAILDGDAPESDGLAVLERLRSWAGEMAIVVLISGQDAVARLRWLEAGADDVVSKPLSFTELR